MAILQLATDCLSYATLPVVILPGNHDPLTTGSVYERSRIGDLPNVHVIGHSGNSSVLLDTLDLEIWEMRTWTTETCSRSASPTAPNAMASLRSAWACGRAPYR